MYKVFKFLASIKLAVVVILSLAVVLSVGTILESQYDAEYAQLLVYQSPWMYGVWALLCVNLIHVMIDRWPWRRRHAGFVCAHIGILVLLLGSAITRVQGVDGIMSLPVHEARSWLSLNTPELTVYSSLGDGEFRALLKTPLQLLLQPPKKHKQIFKFADTQLQLLDYYHYARVNEQVQADTKAIELAHNRARDRARDARRSESAEGPPQTARMPRVTMPRMTMPRTEAVQFQLDGSMGVQNEWLLRPSRKAFTEIRLGPARVVLGVPSPQGGRELFLNSQPSGVTYSFYSDAKLLKQGFMQQGQVLETGWMDWKFRLLKHHHWARIHTEVEPVDGPQGNLTRPAVLLELEGQQQWLPFQSSLRFFARDKMYVVSFGRTRRVLPFDIELKKFYKHNYPGTDRAASYASHVLVDGQERMISMNQPLKHRGFTFYQSSFEQDKGGVVQASILSVNRDPGRWIKYLGSSLMVLGTLLLFTRARARA